MNPSLRKEAGDFAQQQPGLTRLLRALIKKYRSLGRASGSITLKAITAEEAQALQGFFAKPFRVGVHQKIQFRDFEAALDATRFAPLGSLGFLEAFQGKPLQTKKDHSDAREQAFNALMERMQGICKKEPSKKWLHELQFRSKAVRHVLSGLQRHDFETELITILNALNQLPKEPIRLPVFASQINGNPHAFDQGSALGSHLLAALNHLADPQTQESSGDSEQRTQLLAQFNIIRDDIANFTSLIGFQALREGHVLAFWQAAYEDGAAINLPLRELERIERIQPVASQRVFVVENSAVFSALIDAVSPDVPPLICSHGQFKLTFLRLIDALVNEDCQIVYSGDFDPEGLLMAQRLCERHPNHIEPWYFDEQTYQDHRTDMILPESRLAKLHAIHHAGLQKVAQILAVQKNPAYQEAFLHLLASDLRKSIIAT